ncbi:hypothetical protein ACPCUK_22595 [Streptomyces arboris]|uniref:MFS transporter n=1 Tax=Streptomyces arboris TaxID=2600619 RepID=A0A5N5EST9_9ACTN|nr:hypothetical protein [Streptomyces arboris]KAB2593936.1 MFS transporter [Streptomyces arboris]
MSTSQQLGGFIGTGLLNAVATGVTADRIAVGARSEQAVAEATVHGYAVASLWAAGVTAVASMPASRRTAELAATASSAATTATDPSRSKAAWTADTVAVARSSTALTASSPSWRSDRAAAHSPGERPPDGWPAP